MNIEKLTLVIISLGICGAMIRDAHSGVIQQVPIRWCGVRGSPSMEDPTVVGERAGDFTGVLWRRHERVTEEIYLRQGASMTFRSGILAFEVPGDGIGDDDGRCEPGEACRPVQFEILGDNMGDEDGMCERREPCQDPGTFPLIPDPEISPGSRPGDIVSPEFDLEREARRIMSNCRSVWEAAAPVVESIIAVHANQFVSSVETLGDGIGNDDGICDRGEACVGGTPTRTVGAAYRPNPSVGAQQLANQRLVVEDNFYSLARDRADITLGHEIGHTLSLHHGDGVDDNMNYKAPTRNYTDPIACMDPNITNDDLDECPTGNRPDAGRDGMDCGVDPEFGPNLMQYSPGGTMLTPLQVNRIQLQARCHIPSVVIDPVPQPVGDTKVDALQDVPGDFVDITDFGVSVDADDLMTTFFLSTLGQLFSDVRGLYFFVVDLDNNPRTGGKPSDEGIATTFEGAELIGEVRATFFEGEGRGETTVRVKKFQDNAFVAVTDPSISGSVVRGEISVLQRVGEEEGFSPPFTIDSGQVLQLNMSNEVRGSIGTKFRMQAISGIPKGEVIAEAVDTDTTAEAVIDLTLPTFPVCSVEPEAVPPGNTAVVEVTGLVPNFGAHVVFGDEEVTTGSTDAVGKARIPFTVPGGATKGPHLITVGSDGTALTADCVMIVSKKPRKDDVHPDPR